MGVGDKVEGGEGTPSTQDQVILRDEDTRDSDSISLHDEGHHTFNNFIKQTSTDIIEEETTAEPNHTNHGAVNLHDNNKLQDSESLNPIDDNDDMADIVDDAGDQCLDDDTKVDEYNSNPNNPANNPTTDTDDDFSNDFSPIKTVDPKKTNTAFLNNYDSESDQNTCSHDEHIPQQNKSEDDNENIYLELTGGTQLALPEVPELSFPDLPPDNLNLKPAASKNKEAMTHDTHELDNEPDECNTFVTNHAAQQDIVQESFFSSTKDNCNDGQQVAPTTVYSPQQLITTTSAEEQLQSFHSNICTLAAQVDDINNGLSGMGRLSNQTITTMSSGGSAMTSSSCVVSLQSINVPLQPLYNSSNTQPLCKSTSQLEKEDQFENIMRCLQFPDSALQNQQSSTNMSTLDTIVSSLNSPSTTTVFIDTTAVAQSSLPSFNNIHSNNPHSIQTQDHLNNQQQDDDVDSSLYNFQGALSSNLDVMLSQSLEGSSSSSLLHQGPPHTQSLLHQGPPNTSSMLGGIYCSSGGIMSSTPSSTTNQIASTSMTGTSSISPYAATLSIPSVSNLAGISSSNMAGISSNNGLQEQQLLIQNSSTPLNKRMRQKLLEFPDGTTHLIQYESPLQGIIQSINTQGRIGQSPHQYLVAAPPTSTTGLSPQPYLEGGGGTTTTNQYVPKTFQVAASPGIVGQIVNNQLIQNQIIQQSDFYQDHSQYLNVDGRIIKGILAYGDDGNQYVIPDKNAGGDLQPFQVVQGGEKRAKALTVVKRVRKSRQPSLPQQIQQHSQQQQQQQQLVIKNTISGKSRQQQQRHITTTSPMGGGGGQIVQITFADLSGKEARTTNSQNHTDLLQSVVDLSGLGDTILDQSPKVPTPTSAGIHKNDEINELRARSSSPIIINDSQGFKGRAVSLPSSPAPSTRAQLITTETVRKRQYSNPQNSASSSSCRAGSNITAAGSPQQPDSATKSAGKFTILQPKDQPLNPLKVKQDRLDTAGLPTVNENDDDIEILEKARSDDHEKDMFPDTTTNDSCLIQTENCTVNISDDKKEILELNIEASQIVATQSEDEYTEYVYKKKKYASYTNKSDVQDNPSVKGHEHVSTEDQNTSGPSTSKGHNDPTEGHNYGQLEGQGRQGQRTVARVAPFSVAAEGGGGQEESIVHVVEDEIDTLPTAVAATAVDPYEQIECDLQVVTYIQVHSKLAAECRHSSEPRRVSSVKCHNVNHAILGRAGCLMYWWEVKVSRGERRHLHLTFDNPGVKLFFEESAITTMNSALQYFDKDSQKMNDSLDISLCSACVGWAEKKAMKSKQSIAEDTITIIKDVREIKAGASINYASLETANIISAATNVSNYSPTKCGAATAGAPMNSANAGASLEGGDELLQGEVIHKKRGRKRKRANSGEENIYKKVYWHSRKSDQHEEQEQLQIKQRKPRKPRKQFFELFCEFPGCNKVYKSYVVLNSHIQKRHSGAYIATPNSSYAALDTSATPGSPSPSSPSKSFLSNVEAEELFDQDEIDEKDLPWSHYRFKETSGAYSPRKYAKQKEINTNQGFVKKRRGRPRKYPLHSGHIQEILETVPVPADNTEGNFINEDNIKMDIEVGYEHTQDDNETPVKRKRGRPRKYPKQADQIVADLSDQTLDTAVNENDTGSFIDDNSSIMDTDKQRTIIDNDSIKINEFKKLNRNINANDTIENYKTSNKPFAYLTGDNITVPGIKRLPPQDNSIVKVSSQENKSEDNAKSANLENDDAASNNESHNNSIKSVTNKVINESKSTNTPAKKFILAKIQSQDNEPTKNKNKDSHKDKGKSERNESVLDILAKWEQSNKMEDLSEVNKNHDNHDKNIKTITHQVDIKEEPSDTPEIDELAQIKQFIENDTFAKTKVDAAKDNDINDVTDDKEMEEKVDTECIQHDDQMEIEITRNEGSNDSDNMKDQVNLKVVDKAEKSSKKSSRSSSIDEIFNEEIKERITESDGYIMNDLPTDIVDEFDETDGHGVRQSDEHDLQESDKHQVETATTVVAGCSTEHATVSLSQTPLKKRLMTNLDNVSKPFKPLGAKRKKMKVPGMKKQQAVAVEDQTSNNDKILVLSPKLKRGRPRKTNMPRKIRKMAAEKLFPLVQTGQMSANDAFSKLLKKIKDLSFLDFEIEYRKYFIKKEKLQKKGKRSKLKAGGKMKSKRTDQIQDESTVEAAKEPAHEDTNNDNNDLLSNLSAIESQLKSLLEKNPPTDERERNVLKNINSLVTGFI